MLLEGNWGAGRLALPLTGREYPALLERSVPIKMLDDDCERRGPGDRGCGEWYMA
jgi:hypothetical protein